MANLIDITSNILSQNNICFETRNINSELIQVPIENAKFGVLNFTAVTTRETEDELDFLFVVDCSGSMSDICSDGRSKMQHIIHTLKNMIIFFHEHPNININITIYAFDTQMYSIVSRTKITDENFNEIIYKIEKIVPRGSTNIEFALNKSAEKINTLKCQFPSSIINHIFMTDGEATDGSSDITILQSKVIPDITNAFIGFGIEHDASLLNGISTVGKSGYYFIDKLESAGLVYGEILHGIVYKLLTDCEIIVENGLVYNFKTNTWTDILPIGNIVSEANKTYNIISSNPKECKVNIKGNMGNLTILFPSNHIESKNLSVEIYRQRTLQLLYEVNNFSNRNTSRDVLKLKLSNFLEEIKKYMTDNHLENDKILKNLCDDIYICFRTFGTKLGNMYCKARQTSQGTQRLYTVSSLGFTDENNNLTIRRNTLQRRTNSIDITNLSDNSQLPEHTISDFGDTPYLTPQATLLMKEISKPIEKDEDKLSINTQKIN